MKVSEFYTYFPFIIFCAMNNDASSLFIKWQDTKYLSVDDNAAVTLISASGGRLNKKDGLTRYGDSHVKDKTS